MGTISSFLLPGGIFLLTLISGFWLSRLGKPLNPALFNIHKLIALACVVLMVIQVVKGMKPVPAQALLIGMIALAVVSVVALFATGALMSIGKVNYELMHLIHRIAPAVLLVSGALVAYLLTGK